MNINLSLMFRLIAVHNCLRIHNSCRLSWIQRVPCLQNSLLLFFL